MESPFKKLKKGYPALGKGVLFFNLPNSLSLKTVCLGTKISFVSGNINDYLSIRFLIFVLKSEEGNQTLVETIIDIKHKPYYLILSSFKNYTFRFNQKIFKK